MQTPSQRGSRLPWIAGFTMLLVGLVGLAWSIPTLVFTVKDQPRYGPMSVPGDGEYQLPLADYVVYCAFDGSRHDWRDATDGVVVEIFDPSAASLVLDSHRGRIRYGGPSVIASMHTFRVDAEGTYQIVARLSSTPYSEALQVLVQQRVPSHVLWQRIGAIVASAFLFFGGLVLIVVTSVRQSRRRRGR